MVGERPSIVSSGFDVSMTSFGGHLGSPHLRHCTSYLSGSQPLLGSSHWRRTPQSAAGHTSGRVGILSKPSAGQHGSLGSENGPHAPVMPRARTRNSYGTSVRSPPLVQHGTVIASDAFELCHLSVPCSRHCRWKYAASALGGATQSTAIASNDSGAATGASCSFITEAARVGASADLRSFSRPRLASWSRVRRAARAASYISATCASRRATRSSWVLSISIVLERSARSASASSPPPSSFAASIISASLLLAASRSSRSPSISLSSAAFSAFASDEPPATIVPSISTKALSIASACRACDSSTSSASIAAPPAAPPEGGGVLSSLSSFCAVAAWSVFCSSSAC